MIKDVVRKLDRLNELVYAAKKLEETETHRVYQLLSPYISEVNGYTLIPVEDIVIRVPKSTEQDFDQKVVAVSMLFGWLRSVREFPQDEPIPHHDLFTYYDYVSLLQTTTEEDQ